MSAQNQVNPSALLAAAIASMQQATLALTALATSVGVQTAPVAPANLHVVTEDEVRNLLPNVPTRRHRPETSTQVRATDQEIAHKALREAAKSVRTGADLSLLLHEYNITQCEFAIHYRSSQSNISAKMRSAKLHGSTIHNVRDAIERYIASQG